MRHLTASLLLAAAFCAMDAAGAGDIYCNNQGRDCSDRPSPGSTMVRSTSPPMVSSDATQAPTAASAAPTNAGGGAAPSSEEKRAVQNDVAAARASQCKDAKDKYEKAIAARRIYRTGKDGEREYLSDEEADQMRFNERMAMDEACGTKTPPPP